MIADADDGSLPETDDQEPPQRQVMQDEDEGEVLLPGKLSPDSCDRQPSHSQEPYSETSTVVRNFLTKAASDWSHQLKTAEGLLIRKGTLLDYKGDADGKKKLMVFINKVAPLGANSKSMFKINSTQYFPSGGVDGEKKPIRNLYVVCTCAGQRTPSKKTTAIKFQRKRRGSKKVGCLAKLQFTWWSRWAEQCTVTEVLLTHSGHPNPVLVAPHLSQNDNQSMTKEERLMVIERLSEVVTLDRKTAIQFVRDLLGRQILAKNVDYLMQVARVRRDKTLKLHLDDILSMNPNLLFTYAELAIHPMDTESEILVKVLKRKQVLLEKEETDSSGKMLYKPQFKWIVQFGGLTFDGLIRSLSFFMTDYTIENAPPRPHY